MTPAPFARRNVFCSNQLFQNKYEMSEWMQEARAKGMTNPGEIWNYAHQKKSAFMGPNNKAGVDTISAH